MKKLTNKAYITHICIVLGILLLGFTLRTYGINWDQNQHVHPDERFLTMVATTLQVPQSFGDYLDPAKSTLNPYNFKGSGFFVYGTLPMTLTKLVAVATNLDSYDGIALVGRFLSALADMGTLVMVYLIAGVFVRKYSIARELQYWAACIYALLVLPIQQSHFFTSDTFAVFFATGAVWGSLKFLEQDRQYRYTVMAGACVGLAIASKLSAIYICPLIIALYLCSIRARVPKIPQLVQLLLHGIFGMVSAYVFLRLGDPRFFATGNLLQPFINPRLVDNIKELQLLSLPLASFPPGVQWLSVPNILHPFVNLTFWGVGIVVSICAMVGLLFHSVSSVKARRGISIVLALWIVLFFLYQGSQFVKTMRYFYILYPFIALYAGLGLVAMFEYIPIKRRLLLECSAVCLILIWPVLYMRIYSRPHTYVSASTWFYENVPAQSKIFLEHWNDVVPLNLPGNGVEPIRLSNRYIPIEGGVFYPDVPAKIRTLDTQLRDADYVVLANRRTYHAIMKAPERYPLTGQWYKDLLEGRKGYSVVAEFKSYPGIKIGSWEFSIPDEWSEISFTEYDHPRVIILKKDI